jgi:HEAT repeat protein
MPLIRKTSDSLSSPPVDLAAVLAALASGTDDERWAAARAAHDLPGSAQALAEALLRERNSRVREAMFTSLLRIATPECVELLVLFLRSDEAHLRSGGLDALRAMKGAVWPYLPRLLADGDADVRLLACELVRNVPVEEASRLLCGLLESELEPNVCASAVEVLAEVGGAEALPVLARCEQRFRATPFLAFSIKIAADRIRSQSS